MLAWIKSLYAHPTAQVKINNTPVRDTETCKWHISGVSPFPIIIHPVPGTPFLEPSTNMMPYMASDWAAFADDLIFLTQPQVSLPNLIQVLEQYGYISNSKINYARSQILNVPLLPQMIQSLQASFPFCWAAKAIKYLVVSLTADHLRLYNASYLPLLRDISA